MTVRSKDARKPPPGDTIACVDHRSTIDAEGYVEEIPYTYGYHPELDPLRMQAALRHAGVVPPAVSVACELGFGQGISLAIHAVAGGVRWFGTDLLPVHVEGLRALTAGTGARLEVADQRFAEFCLREDLPTFDFIGANGVWSWVSAANRDRIIGLLRRRLRPGGVFFLSYNALPGWAPMLPLREVMIAQVRSLPTGMPLAERIDSALQHVRMRLLRDAVFAEAHPEGERELRAILGKGAAYLAHEFFNRDWAPMHPSAVAEMLSAAGLRFAAHAGDEAPVPQGRFRREYWVMGDAEPSDAELADAARGNLTTGDERVAGCRRLNARLLSLATRTPGLAWLASPLTGGGVEVGYTAMLLLEAWQRGLRDPVAIAREAQTTLSRLGQRLVKEGEVVTDPVRNREMLAEQARIAIGSTLPRLQALRVL